MRVAGGAAKGRRLRGATIEGARPTSERVRGAIFNVLGPLDDEPTRVLDLYAGSGSLGIEALSRGALWADFVERHPRQCAAIRENLEATGYSRTARVQCMDAGRAIRTLEGPYQLVLMDPPYALVTLDDVLEELGASGLLDEGGTLVVGHSKRLTLKGGYPKLDYAGQRRYGDSVVDYFRRENA